MNAAHDPGRLWRQFLMLTQEMKKFIEQDNVDLFLELGRQRQIVFERIRGLSEDTFRHTPDGEALLRELQPIDLSMQQTAKRWLNRSRQRNETVRAYIRAYEYGGPLAQAGSAGSFITKS